MFGVEGAARQFRTDRFSFWDKGYDTFGCEVDWRLFRADRFTTIYHRPTRRRQASIVPDGLFPESLVVRHEETQDVYIVSETKRTDSVRSGKYDTLVSLHLATEPSGGKGSIMRPTVTGPPGDLGVADLVSIATIYYDLELRTSSAEPETVDATQAMMFVTLPAWIDLREGDWLFTGQGETYEVNEPYYDGGFQLARAIRKPVDLVDMVYLYDEGTGGSYDVSTGIYTPVSATTKDFSGVVYRNSTEASGMTNEEPVELQVYISSELIDWVPEVNRYVLISGIRHKITSAVLGKNRKQWHLTLVRAPLLGAAS